MAHDIEDWKIVDGHGWDYWVSSHGRVMSFKGRYPLMLSPGTKSGYPMVNLVRNGVQKSTCIHRIVASAFLKNPNLLPVVNHKDGDKNNNHVSNLEWCTYSVNNKHAHDTGLIKQKVGVVALSKHGRPGYFYPSMNSATADGFHQGHISAVCLGKKKTHASFEWRRVDMELNA